VAYLSRAVRNARAMMRSAEFGDSSIPPNSAMPSLRTGQGGIESAALGISTVLSCVKALYDDVTRAAVRGLHRAARRGPEADAEIQPPIIAEPFGPDLEPGAGFGQLTVSRAMRGNAYFFVSMVNPRTGLPDQGIVLHPDAVKTMRKDGRKVHRIGGETYLPFRRDGGDLERIVHIPGLMMPGSVEGLDILTIERMNLDLTDKVLKYAHGFFGGGGSPSGVVSVPGPGDRRKAREVADQWEAAHGGVTNAHRPAVMFGGATWEQLSVTPENAQFLATRAYQREEVCGLFGVPLMRIQAIVDNASQGGGKGLDAMDAGYVKHGLLPIGNAIEAAWNKLIPGDQGSWTGFDYDEFLRANAEVRATVASQHRVGGIRTIDEIRAPEGWEPLPDGKGSDPFSPLNSNTASPAGGADNAPAPAGLGG
jgi:HK97 family phage portal protein